MPLFRLKFTSDALIHGVGYVRADSLAEATAIGEWSQGKHGIKTDKLESEVEWGEATFLDNADFEEAEELTPEQEAALDAAPEEEPDAHGNHPTKAQVREALRIVANFLVDADDETLDYLSALEEYVQR